METYCHTPTCTGFENLPSLTGACCDPVAASGGSSTGGATSTPAPGTSALTAQTKRLVVDPTDSSATLTVAGSSPISTAISGAMLVTITDSTSVINSVRLGLGPFSVAGKSYQYTTLFNESAIPFLGGDGYLSVPHANATTHVNSMVDNVLSWGTLSPNEDLWGGYFESDWYLNGTLSDSLQSVSFTVHAKVQPTGTDTDGDGVPDIKDNCPAIANPTQARTGSPTLIAPPPVTLSSCSSTMAQALDTPTVSDLCAAPPLLVTNNTPAKFPLGTTTVTWRASDGAGNVTVATQLVTVVLGKDASCCPAGTNIIMGTSNNDTLIGTPGADCIIGLGAQDTIWGRGGNDYISGGDGNDILYGEDGNDYISGGTGQDRIDGGNGNDTVSGDDGDDICGGGARNDWVIGGQGNDKLNGGPGTDTCTAATGSDTYTDCETKN